MIREGAGGAGARPDDERRGRRAGGEAGGSNRETGWRKGGGARAETFPMRASDGLGGRFTTPAVAKLPRRAGLAAAWGMFATPRVGKAPRSLAP